MKNKTKRRLIWIILISGFIGYELFNYYIDVYSTYGSKIEYGFFPDSYLDPSDGGGGVVGLDFMVSDHIVCIKGSTAIALYDFSNPKNPQLMKDPLAVSDIYRDRLPKNMIKAGDVLEIGWLRYNISDRTNPINIGFDQADPDLESSAYLYDAGSVYYTISQDNFFILENLSEPRSKANIANYTGSSDARTFSSMIVDGNYVYIMWDLGVLGLNITDPHNIERIFIEETNLPPNSMVLKDNHLLIASDYGLECLDVSDKTDIKFIKRYQGKIAELNLYGDVLIAREGGYSGSLKIYNISDPIERKLLFEHDRLLCDKIHIDGNRLYISGIQTTSWGVMREGLFTIDLNEWLALQGTPSANLKTPYTTVYAEDVFIKNGIAYLADGDHGIKCLEIEKSSLNLLGTRDVGDWAYDIVVDGDYAYVAYGSDGLRIFDISDPSNPIDVGQNNTDGNSYGLDVKGYIAYVADGTNGISIINCSDKKDPVEISNIDTPGNASEIVVKGEIAYLNDWNSILIFNVSDATNPELIKTLSVTDKGTDIDIIGSNLYVQSYDLGLSIYDVSDPHSLDTNPTPVGVYSTASGFTAFDVFGNIAGLCINNTRYEWINISDPTNPERIGYIDLSGCLNETVIENDIAYIAAGDQGILMYDIGENPMDDFDNDTIISIQERLAYNTNYLANDTDDDGMDDYYEVQYYNARKMEYDTSYRALDPTKDDASVDVDRDGLTNLQEFSYGTDPLSVDTDEDQADDGFEIKNGVDPLDAASTKYQMDYVLIGFVVAVVAVAILSILRSLGIFVKKAPMNAFLSHAVIDFEKYKIEELAEFLGGTKLVNKGFYCEQDMKGNIDDWMDQMVPLSHLFIFIATEKSVFNSPDCAREIRLAKENGTFLLPIRTPEVSWDDIGEIGLPKRGFDYPTDNPEKLYDELAEFVNRLKDAMNNLKKMMSKEEIVDLASLDEVFELNSGDTARLAKILIKSEQVEGVVTSDKRHFLNRDEVITRVKLFHEEDEIENFLRFLDTIGIDADYFNEVQIMMGIKKKKRSKE